MEPFNVEELLATARQRTGLSDFGPDDFREGLTALVGSLNAQGKLSDQGRRHAHERLLRLLMNRLWFARDMAEHPEIAEEDISSPIIIATMPRTGSTKLQRLLSASEDFQTLLLWKLHMYARIPGLEDGGRARRIQETRDYEKWMYATSPDIIASHPLFTDEPDEDHLLSESTFRNVYLDTLFNVPEYGQWRTQANMGPTDDYFLMQLKYLQWQAKLGKRVPWLLKSPNYFGQERHLSTLFKKPRFIAMHRDPAKCIPSSANIIQSMHKLYSDHETTVTSIGAWLSQMFANLAEQHMEWRDDNPDVQVLDLSFREINEDGIGTARKVYEFIGMPLSTSAENAMRKWELNNPREKHGKNVYSAEAIGTSDQDIHQTFSSYLKRFARFV